MKCRNRSCRPRSVSMYIFYRIGPEAMQSVIAFRAYCQDDRFGIAICRGDDRAPYRPSEHTRPCIVDGLDLSASAPIPDT